MSAMVQAFGDEAEPARRLASALSLPLGLIDLHTFPDGERLPTVPDCPSTVVVYRSLDRPDAKIMPLLLAADALRRGGVSRLVLVAPYLCYLRQDVLFAPGQPLSQPVIGELIGSRFDAATEARLQEAGATRVVSTDSCPNPTNAARLAPWLAEAVQALG